MCAIITIYYTLSSIVHSYYFSISLMTSYNARFLHRKWPYSRVEVPFSTAYLLSSCGDTESLVTHYVCNLWHVLQRWKCYCDWKDMSRGREHVAALMEEILGTHFAAFCFHCPTKAAGIFCCWNKNNIL